MSEGAGVVLDGFHDHVGHGRLAKVECASAGFVQQSIHGVERLSGSERGRRESSVGRQAVVETPREENGLWHLVEVRESPPVERHTGVVPEIPRNSRQKTGRPGGRPRTGGAAPPSTRAFTSIKSSGYHLRHARKVRYLRLGSGDCLPAVIATTRRGSNRSHTGIGARPQARR